VHKLEVPHPQATGDKTQAQLMVKKFQRSSADHELQVPELIRTPQTLLHCIEYIEQNIMTKDLEEADPRFDEPVPTIVVYLFVWDRFRMIAKDFTMQISGAQQRTSTWVECHERMARWFVLMDHRMKVSQLSLELDFFPTN